jgi:hypothetical protein
LTFFEVENTYLNLDGIKRKSQKVLSGFKDSQSVIHILKTIKKIIIDHSKSFITTCNNDFLNKIDNNSKFKFKPILSFIDNKFDFVFNCPHKNILENFYNDSVLTKNSVILSKRAQEKQKNAHNIF